MFTRAFTNYVDSFLDISYKNKALLSVVKGKNEDFWEIFKANNWAERERKKGSKFESLVLFMDHP